jgi:hypothetical protein
LLRCDEFYFRDHPARDANRVPCIFTTKDGFETSFLGGHYSIGLPGICLLWTTNNRLGQGFRYRLGHLKRVQAYKRKDLQNFAQESLYLRFFRFGQRRLLWLSAIFEMASSNGQGAPN